MKVDLLDLKEQYSHIEKDIDLAIKEVLRKAQFIMGENVTKLEKDLAEYTGVRHAIAVANGTDALMLIMRYLNLKDGDEVITSPYTFFASAEVASLFGATPVFVDIDKKTLCLDPEKLEEKITKKTKTIIPIHIFGQMCDMDKIIAIADKYSIPVVEDACQAIGAEYKGKKAGSIGLAGAYSFFPTKNLGCFGDGGMITTDDDQLADELRMLRVHGSKTKYIHEKIGYNSRLDELQAAILNVKFGHLDEWNKKRNENAKYYSDKLTGLDIELPYEAIEGKHVFHQYCIQVDKNKRDKLREYLAGKGISTTIYYPVPVHLLPVYEKLGGNNGDCPVAESVCERTIALPIYPELTREKMDYVVNTIREFFEL